MAEVHIAGVTKRFGAVTAVADLTLTIGDGEFIILLGPTGAGKTTTLRLVAGLERAEAGHIRIGGRDVTGTAPGNRDVAFVFQQYSLYPHLSVFDNMAFPLRAPGHRVAEAVIRARISEIASLLHIEDKLENRATALSGGEMQRVAIGRALVRDPAIYLMDEPLSSLDAKLRAELRLELKRIHAELGATLLYVTHDQIEAMTMADRVGILREGRLVQIATPREIYERPNSAYVASRLGTPRINLLPVDAIPTPNAPPGVVTMGIRTEHLRIGGVPPAPGGAMARVERIEHLGDQDHLHLRLGNYRLIVLVAPDSALASGEEISVALSEPLYFDAEGNRIEGRGTQAATERMGDEEWPIPAR